MVSLNHLQQRPQALIFDHGGLVDLPNFVERAIRQILPLEANGDPAIWVVHYRYALAYRRLSRFRRLQDEEHLVVLQRERLGEGAFLLPSELIIKLVEGDMALCRSFGLAGTLPKRAL